MEIKIVENRNKLKSKEEFILDKHLFKLINICSTINLSLNDYLFIRELFYLTENTEYEKHLKDYKTYQKDFTNALQIYELFKEWKPFIHYNLGLLRGNFLELLSYKLLNTPF